MGGWMQFSLNIFIQGIGSLETKLYKKGCTKITKKYFGDIRVDPMNSNPVLDWNKICQLAVKSAGDVILEPFYN